MALALEYPGANTELRRFFAPLHEALERDVPETGELHSAAVRRAAKSGQG